jgi:GR25 family glycosyltransferase involved in LPS biosynthesis
VNFREGSGSLGASAFRLARAAAALLPARRIAAFGKGEGRIASIMVISLDRQSRRWRTTLRELGRFRTADGSPLPSIVRRLAAIDARDGRAVAATADVDPVYQMRHQLFVQPDARLDECFGLETAIRMTRQEVAVARSHIEAWKAIAAGDDHYVLVLEDDVWFRCGAARAIERGWSAALRRWPNSDGPHMLYLSYRDAGGTAERAEPCSALFRPVRGLWFLSGYVLSREGAAALLRAMPVIGPVDLWINQRFSELRVVALSSPALLQTEHHGSDNSYSIVPYLARAGIVDAGAGPMRPHRRSTGQVLAWARSGETDSLGMALSMLGFRVRTFDDHEPPLAASDLFRLGELFDALVNPQLAADAPSAAIAANFKFVVERAESGKRSSKLDWLPASRTAVLGSDARYWTPICALLQLDEPAEAFPCGTPRRWRTFCDDRSEPLGEGAASFLDQSLPLDDSPWVLPAEANWRPRNIRRRAVRSSGEVVFEANLTEASPLFPALVETFPGNLASFSRTGVEHGPHATRLVLSPDDAGVRTYRSGALATVAAFRHGRFEAEIRAARGSGLITGLFLHRDSPRQEIDIELLGADPRIMLANVYFNPGDDGAALGFGYRGSPCHIDLGFDASLDFHHYAIDWRAGRILWLVDGSVVHERVSWDPTPIPHLPMHLHANLWAPRSENLAGCIDAVLLPATAGLRNVSIRA